VVEGAVFHSERLRYAFLGFHLVLGVSLLWSSVHTVLDLGASDIHAGIIGFIEAVAAVAFLIPLTLRYGAGMLLLILLAATVVHAGRGEWRPDLLVYAAGVLLVGVHGSAHRPAVGA
jgi:uncharacterized membrane protein YphA (DoxX/SURF4 family)